LLILGAKLSTLMQFKQIITLLAIAAALQGCYKKSGYWKNSQIDPSIHNDFHQLDDQLLADLKKDDAEHLKAIESKDAIENLSIRQFDIMSNHVQKSDYKILDEYYAVNRYKDIDTIINRSGGINSYSLSYEGFTHEMYFAFFVPKTGNNQWMITAMFCKYSYGWKLNSLELGLYKINGKTGPELAAMAQDEYHKGFLVNSANLIQLAQSCIDPSKLWRYDLEDTIRDGYSIIGRDVEKKFRSAIVLSNVPTHPRIVKIFSGEFQDGYYPMIYYQTTINVNDTTAIRKENNAIMNELPKVIPGVDKDTPWLLFTAFNKLPNPQENVPRYEMDNRVGK
jgi:hypothetical protein